MAAASTMGWMNWLSIAALGTGIVALVVSLGIFIGPIGPRGDGTLMAWTATDEEGLLTETCASYAQVTITVPGPGTVVVTAMVLLIIAHFSGEDDDVRLGLSSTPGQGCGTNDPVYGGNWRVSPAEEFTFYTFNPFLQRPFVVTEPGTYRFQVDAKMVSGPTPSDRLESVVMVAVFYPT